MTNLISSASLRVFRPLGAVIVFSLFSMQAACATLYRDGAVYSGETVQEVPLTQVIDAVRPGSVVLVSENHGLKPHHERQAQFLSALLPRQLRVSVGLEFFAYTLQEEIDAFVRGEQTEEEFLRRTEWKGGDFADYRQQALFPRQSGGRTLGLNAPRTLTGKIASSGLDSLTEEEEALLPPGFTLGTSDYFERFREVMQGHVAEEKLRNYFAAQSAWDDTMAWVIERHLQAHPDDVVVVIVGDFHAAYGGGLPDRLKARGLTQIVTVSQVNLKGLSESEERETVEPHPRWGARADYIWVAN